MMFLTKKLHVQCSMVGENRNVKVSVAAKPTTKSVGETRSDAGEERKAFLSLREIAFILTDLVFQKNIF